MTDANQCAGSVSRATIARGLRRAYAAAKEADEALRRRDLPTAEARLSDLIHRLSFDLDYVTAGGSVREADSPHRRRMKGPGRGGDDGA